MATLTSQKVQGFLTSPHTYPKGGLGFGADAGAISAARGNGPHSANRMKAEGTAFPMRVASGEKVLKDTKAGTQIKSADFKESGMLENIKQLALEKCAGDEKLAYEFLQGFFGEVLTKQAAFGMGSLQDGAIKGLGEGLGKGLAGAVLGLGAASLGMAVKGIQKDQLHNEFVNALRQAITSNPILRQAKKEKVVKYAETIFKFAPHIATDANLLSSILANAVHGEGVDPQTIRTLTDLEARYTDTRSVSTFSPKSYV